MGIAIPLLAGLALALLLERAVLAWAPGGAMPGQAGLSMPVLAWQRGSWRPFIARAFAASVPVVVLIAATRFEGIDALRTSILALALIACCATDLLAYRVPDGLTLPAFGSALAFSAVTGQPPLVESVAAALLAITLLTGAALLTRGGLGGGDMKLGALAGAALGLPSAAIALGVGIVAGGLVVILLAATHTIRRDQGVPFAPFLALPAVVCLLAT